MPNLPPALQPSMSTVGVATVILLLSGCDGGPALRHRPPAPSGRALPPPAAVTSATAVPRAPPPVEVASACPPSAALGSAVGLPERQGIGRGATLWALFFPTEPTLTTGQELKVVWRMTG